MKQSEILRELGKIGAVRRGQISEQWYPAHGRDGKPRLTGPYYVWSRCVDGKKRSVRIPRKDAPRALAELERGREASALMREFWENAEALAEGKKKAPVPKSLTCREPSSGRPRN
jgi:hypothetical protein